jgi:methionine synthase II (cobalamin-independent)
MLPLTPMAATGIGSVPFTDPGETVSLILETLPQIPYWPQMVRLGFREEMTAQAARGLAVLKIDEAARTVQVDPALARDQALAGFYEAALSGDLKPFALAEEEAHGFFALHRAVAAGGHPCRVLKGQLAGPVTFAGMVKDQAGKAILFDRELTQAVCLGLALKAAWQIQSFRDLGKDPVIFLDEPYLTGFGSAYLPISREEVLEILGQTIEELRQAAGGPVAVGLHCCGNTDWGLLLEAPIDLLSFDSYGYFDSLRLYEKPVAKFFDRGGWLAWGLVPTLSAEDLARETTDSLWQRFTGQVAQLAQDLKTGSKDILSRAILTPACGIGYLTPEEARRSLKVLADLSLRGQEWLASL